MNLQDNKQELITKYRKVYSEFIESIDFEQLQQGDKEDYEHKCITCRKCNVNKTNKQTK